MDLSQMVVQAIWEEKEAVLRQIPWFGDEVIGRCKEVGVESVYDLMDMEDGKRLEVLGMSNKQMWVFHVVRSSIVV